MEKRDLARGDGFHWKPPAYQILADQAVESIEKALVPAATGADEQAR